TNLSKYFFAPFKISNNFISIFCFIPVFTFKQTSSLSVFVHWSLKLTKKSKSLIRSKFPIFNQFSCLINNILSSSFQNLIYLKQKVFQSFRTIIFVNSGSINSFMKFFFDFISKKFGLIYN